ncbi:hypothetical protein SDC9_62894 [bioreactor metagenome]|uniref:DUF4330 domain-containing protein n=1 Tax=bioreactor metagenome TaxID=1076179 RepID=A0A644XQI9_9ZZZZ
MPEILTEYTESWCSVDSKRRRKSGFNLFDLFILLIVAAAVVLIFWLVGGRKSVAVEGAAVKVTYKVEVTAVTEDYKDSARVGDTVRDGVRKSDLGKITAVKVSPMTSVTSNILTGEAVKAESPTKYKVELTCEADGSLTQGRVSIGSYNIGVGTEIYVQSYGFSGKGYCVAMSYEEGGEPDGE